MNILILIVLLLPFLVMGAASTTAGEAPPPALLLIDIQAFYFPGSPSALVEPEKAATAAKRLLENFRQRKWPVIHVFHKARALADIHPLVVPLPIEKQIEKSHVNAFRETDLLEYLKGLGVKRLFIAGMMTHMCVEAAVRAAVDYGFVVTVVEDACATKDLTHGETRVKAADVHASTLAAIAQAYGKVKRVDEVIEEKPKVE